MRGRVPDGDLFDAPIWSRQRDSRNDLFNFDFGGRTTRKQKPAATSSEKRKRREDASNVTEVVNKSRTGNTAKRSQAKIAKPKPVESSDPVTYPRGPVNATVRKEKPVKELVTTGIDHGKRKIGVKDRTRVSESEGSQQRKRLKASNDQQETLLIPPRVETPSKQNRNVTFSPDTPDDGIERSPINRLTTLDRLVRNSPRTALFTSNKEQKAQTKANKESDKTKRTNKESDKTKRTNKNQEEPSSTSIPQPKAANVRSRRQIRPTELEALYAHAEILTEPRKRNQTLFMTFDEPRSSPGRQPEKDLKKKKAVPMDRQIQKPTTPPKNSKKTEKPNKIFKSKNKKQTKPPATTVPAPIDPPSRPTIQERNERTSSEYEIPDASFAGDDEDFDLIYDEDAQQYFELQNSDKTNNRVTIPKEGLTKFVSFIAPKNDIVKFSEDFPGVSISSVVLTPSTQLAYCKIAPKTLRPMDFLRKGQMLIWIIEGKVTVRSGGGFYSLNDGRKTYMYGQSLSKGSCIIIPGGTYYTIENRSSSEVLLGFSVSQYT